jgi:hypothetical protein
MKTWKIVTFVALAIVAVALATSSAFAYMGRTALSAGTYNSGTGLVGNYGVTSGMMGGRGMMGGNGYAYTPTTPITPNTLSYPAQRYWGRGCGMMNRGAYATTGTYPTTPTTLNITTAVAIAQNYIVSLGNPNIAVSQVEEYTQNFYVQVAETNTHAGAFELLVSKTTGAVSAEPGPNMMWNTKYGMMSNGYMGISSTAPTTTMPMDATQAGAIAQQYLKGYQPGTTTGNVTTFYGYYTIEVLSGSSPFGMLSVNGYTRQVWSHTWHGSFIQEVEL